MEKLKIETKMSVWAFRLRSRQAKVEDLIDYELWMLNNELWKKYY